MFLSKEVNKLTVLKRCELCIEYTNCKIYDEVCEKIDFLKNFTEINSSNEIAEYCEKYKTKRVRTKQIDDITKELNGMVYEKEIKNKIEQVASFFMNWFTDFDEKTISNHKATKLMLDIILKNIEQIKMYLK